MNQRASDAPGQVPVVEYRGLRIRGPEKVKTGQWRVTAVDTVLEECAEKVFASRLKAQAFIDELAHGKPPAVDPLAHERTRQQSTILAPDFKGMVPPSKPTLDKRHTRYTPTGEAVHGPKDPDRAPFNIKAVKETLESYGLDPFAEIARVLTEDMMIRRRDGSLVLDEETGEPVRQPIIGGLDRAKILVELGQYVQPKLKSIEMKVEDLRKLNQEQLDAEIQKLLSKPRQQ